MLKRNRWLTFYDAGSDGFRAAASPARMSEPIFVITVAFPACRCTVFTSNWCLIALDVSSTAVRLLWLASIAMVTRKEEKELTDMFDIPCETVV